MQDVFGTFLATVAEVEVDEHGEVYVRRIVCAVDCGIVVNPDTVVAQIEGGMIFGLTAALLRRDHARQGTGSAEQLQ